MLELLDEYALLVLSRAGEYAAGRGSPQVEPDDVVDALCREHRDLLDFALRPQRVRIEAEGEPGASEPGAADLLLLSARTRDLLRAAVAEATARDRPVVVEVRDLLMGAFAAVARDPQPDSDTRADDLVQVARRLDLAALRGRLQQFARDSALDNQIASNLEYDPPQVIRAAVAVAEAAGSRRIEPPHLLRALQSSGVDMMRIVLARLHLDLDELPLRTGPDSDYRRGAAGDQPAFSRDCVLAFAHARQLEAGWSGNLPMQGAVLCALFATWPPARSLLTRSGLSQDVLERLVRGQRDKTALEDPHVVRAVLMRDWAGSPVAPLLDRTTVLARRCLAVATNIAHFFQEPAVTPFHVGAAALHVGGEDRGSSVSVALDYLRADWSPMAEIFDRPVPHELAMDGRTSLPLPLAPETVQLLLSAPTIATRMRREAADTCVLLVAAAERDSDIRSSIQIRGGVTIDLLTSAAATNAAHVSGPDAVVHPARDIPPRRAVLVEPTPEAAADLGGRTSTTSHLRELLFRGEMSTGEFLNSDLQLNRLLRYRLTAIAQSGLDALRLTGTVAAAASGGWWLLATFAGHGLRPGRVPAWTMLLEAVPILLLPPWLGAVIALSLVPRALEAWWALQWRRAATGDPSYDMRRMRRDNYHSVAGGGLNLMARRRTRTAT